MFVPLQTMLCDPSISLPFNFSVLIRTAGHNMASALFHPPSNAPPYNAPPSKYTSILLSLDRTVNLRFPQERLFSCSGEERADKANSKSMQFFEL